MANLERELKLEVDDGFRLPDLTAALDLTVVTEPDRELAATYYDTADLRLARWGVTLRYRTTNGRDGRWTLKLPTPGAPSGEAGLSREEVDFDAPPEEPPADALTLVTALHRRAAVEQVATLTTTRRIHSLHASADKLAEIDEDRVRYATPAGRRGNFHEVEVELEPATPEALLGRVASLLEVAGARRTPSEPKIVRALGTRPDPEVSVPHVDTDSTAGALIAGAVASSVHRLLVHDPGVRLGLDIESVHQARVATRRLRSDLGTVSSLLHEGWALDVRRHLRDLGSRLGTVRDTDVLMERLRDATEALPVPDRPPAEAVLKLLGSQRDSERQALIEYMESPSYVAVVEMLLDAAREQPVRDPGAPASTLFPLVAERWRRLVKRVRKLDPTPTDDQLHRVRIDTKRCRYAVELLAPAVGKPAKNLARALADLQTVLGDLHDAVVAEQWLRHTAQVTGPDEALAAGLLAAAERSAQAEAREAWGGEWRIAREKHLRAWLE